jgi:N,N-dimethylformamidase beta subunit-like, C-terminal
MARASLSLAACLLVVSGLGVSLASDPQASASARRGSNPIQRENALPGSPGWRLPRSAPGSIEGYASQISVVAGDELDLHVSTNPPARYRVEVYRIGWYGGSGARLLACAPGCGLDEPGSAQPVPPFDETTGYLDAGWPVTDRFTVGTAWTSGYYLAELVLTDGANAGRGSWVPFIVREPPAQASNILVQASVNTWQAYNDWGGRSLYSNFTGIGDNHVSFDRPFDEQTMVTAAGPATDNANLPQVSEFPLVRFFEHSGYDVSYATDVDTDANPGGLLRHRLVVTNGHDEYWTKGMRDAFERARAAGTNLAFVGANTDFWQIRYEDGRRTVVEYRKAGRDPETDPAQKTVMARNLEPPRPECELLGVQGIVEPGQQSIGVMDLAVNPAALADPWFAQTGFTATSVLPGLVGYEWDLITPGCRTPPLTDLFHSPGSPSADAVRYTAPSGARVFSAGSLRFSWGLDDSTAGDPRLQRFMRNALDDLTRPAPPSSLRAIRTRTGVRIVVRWPPDPRPRELLVYEHPGGAPFQPPTRGARLVCVTRGRVCVDSHSPHVRAVRYAAILRDRWRPSFPLFSARVR